MKKISDNIYESDSGKLFVRLSDSYIMGNLINLGDSDSINNYTEQSYSDSEIEAFNRKWGGGWNTKLDSGLTVTYEEVYNDNRIVINANNDSTGDINIVLLGTEQIINSQLINGSYIAQISDIDAENHSFIITYSGDDKYKGSNKKLDVFTRYSSPMIVNIDGDVHYVGDILLFNVILPTEATGKVSLLIGGIQYESNVINGRAKFNIHGLTEGHHEIDVTYQGDTYYRQSKILTEVVIEKCIPSFTAVLNSTTIMVGKSASIICTVSGDATGLCKAELGGALYSGSVNNGKAKITIPTNLTAGTYKIITYYEGDDKYYASDTIQLLLTVTKK